jgi:hypothetical protein
MNEKIHAFAETAVFFKGTSTGMLEVKFIVREEDEAAAVLDELVPVPLVRMAQGNGNGTQGAYLHALDANGFVAESGFQVFIPHREIGRGENFRDHALHELLGKRASLQADTRLLMIDRFEKRKAHEMIPVGMGKKDIVGQSLLSDQSVAEPANSCACIHNDNAIVFCSDFKTGRVAAIPGIFLTGYGNGSPGSPAPDEHTSSDTPTI